MRTILFRRINIMKYSLLTKLLLFLLVSLFSILIYQFISESRLRHEHSTIQHHLLAQKNREILHLKSVLKKFNVPSSNYEASDLPLIYVITPTYSRLVQKAELTRMKNVLLHISNLYWIVVEDALQKSQLVSNFLKTSGINYVHLTKETPSEHKLKSNLPRYYKHRGVYQRNEGINWLSRNYLDANSIVYFADDDNTYSIELFDEIRKTKKVAIWPVALVGGVKLEQPLVKDKKITGWNVGWKPERPFATDMAGFSVNLGLLLSKETHFKETSSIGYIESDFLSQMITPDELEPLADDCSKVLVWHTQTKEANLKDDRKITINRDIEV